MCWRCGPHTPPAASCLAHTCHSHSKGLVVAVVEGGETTRLDPKSATAALGEHPHLARPVFSSRNRALELLLSWGRRMK